MTKPWLKHYQDGVAEEINPESYASIPSLLEESFKKFASKPSFHCMGKTLTYGEIDHLSKKFASYLQNDLGLQKGDRVAIMMPNILQYPVALFGILRAGMVCVNVNPLYTARELEHQLTDSQSKVIIIFENSASVLAEVVKNTPIEHVLVTQIGDMLKFPKSLLVNFVIKHVKKMVPSWDLPGAKSFLEALDKGDESKYKRPEIINSDLAFLQYTGGTTGVSKGAELTHRNIVANLCQAGEWISPVVEEGKEIIITPLPLYHIFSLTANCFTFSKIGALNVLITNPRDIPGFVKELKKWNFTALTGVNTLFNGLLNNEDFKTVDFSHLKLTLGGGMAVQRAVAERWKEVTKTPLIEAYGLTETSPAACINPMDLKDYNGMIGLPVSSTDACIKDDDGNTLNAGEVGEICIKGPQVMKGYWGRPEETAKVMTTDGYFKTGDIGVMNEEGFFKIVDRKKDMILVSGFNVYPNEVEEIIVTHPKVFECAAVGVPNEKSGEVVKLFVVKNDQSLTEEELMAFCKENLTGYKRPKFIEFRDELPKSNVGKILRKDLRGQ
ncbi:MULTISPECIES: long-chain-fatty-acid--CoA ligase [Halobacteriovorax]|uniref:Long-chain-fatty-acid--CoA ligase n=1 Tax=Halobacteriovorax vibrionivorans TaxID=2152716 RepID=A0ABY0IKP8_9BACT|nr:MULTISPECIES: long-chain-fatty-acid--CoA ligase [Halobacteriovorax]RZF21877.1 long-chain-fatty-acid--CoA ligase [Halobacteriovorax vibrionivorans]TGD45838.1 long-chain-fatty-acid--CoA ligase [Halobacteriovorax sp. Y22]